MKVAIAQSTISDEEWVKEAFRDLEEEEEKAWASRLMDLSLIRSLIC